MADLNDVDDTRAHAVATLTAELVASAPGTVTCRVGGQLDVSTERILREVLQGAALDSSTALVLDVTNLEFMDSSGLAVVLGAARRARSIEMRNPTQIVRRIVAIAGLADVLPMIPADG